MADDVRIVSIESLRAERRTRGEKRKRAILNEPLARLITSDDGVTTLTQQFTLNVNEARDDVPLLYPSLYSRVASDTLPESVPTNLISNAQVIFLQRFEGGEVRFGTLAKGAQGTVPIVNYSAGFEYTHEMVMYNQQWRVDLLTTAFGEAYNALLNHLHLGPILSFSYTSPNQTAADSTGATLLDKTRNTLINAIRAASIVKNPARPGSILLAATANKFQLQDAIAKRFDNVGNTLPAVNDIDTIILYDGWSGTVGDKPYSYPGVTSGKAYLICPKRRLYELVRTEGGRDLIQETGNADVSRRIDAQIVNHTYRGVYADIANSVQEVTLP